MSPLPVRLLRNIKFFLSVMKHKYYVWRGSRKVGGVPWHRILFHDLMKFHPQEASGYINRFLGPGDRPVLFERAWVHHQNHCDHHWEYWINRSRHKKDARNNHSYLVPMPIVCIREMVSDWIGASIVYSGRADMTDWLNDHLGKMWLHEDTKGRLAGILIELGYIDAVKKL